jgi:lipopolysaccharide export LptBFGC system permease protein LptF
VEEPKGSNKAIIGIIIVVILVAATTGVVAPSGRDSAKQTISDDTNKTVATTTSGNSTATDKNSSSSTTASTNFKDGTYDATGSYATPGGQESIDVKVTLASGVITDATVTQQAISDEAHEYQAAFVSGYKSQVVGRKISDVSLSRVSGSSLTPGGFNSALDIIKSQAAA